MIAHRRADAIDQRFIIDSWVGSYRDADSAGFIQVGDWYPVMIGQVKKTLERPDVVATVAYETSDPDRGAELYGWIVADVVERPPLVYYVFVKRAYRKSGVARGLFAAVGIRPGGRFHYVCSTEAVHELEVAQKIPLAKWCPNLGRFPKSERRTKET